VEAGGALCSLAATTAAFSLDTMVEAGGALCSLAATTAAFSLDTMEQGWNKRVSYIFLSMRKCGFFRLTPWNKAGTRECHIFSSP
jgi:hypothetical protein